MRRTTSARRAMLALLLTLGVSPALADPLPAVPETSATNYCGDAGGRGEDCGDDPTACDDNRYATACVQRSVGGDWLCDIPCFAEQEDVDLLGAQLNAKLPAKCALGERCVEGEAISPPLDGAKPYYCKPVKFRVDLNLLDQCIARYLGGEGLGAQDEDCSLEHNLNRLLDQNGDSQFDIFDLDLCILAFLDQPTCGCEEEAGCACCASGDLACASDGRLTCHDPEACSFEGEGGVCAPDDDCPFDDSAWVCRRGGCASDDSGADCERRDCTVTPPEVSTSCPSWEAEPLAGGTSPEVDCCAADEDCGAGLYCDAIHHVCQRDCGVVASREEEIDDFERPCTGALKVCDYARGHCVTVDPSHATCDVDADCLSGAYCFLGRCTPQCYRAVDCPSGEWFCDTTNRCRALPHPEADEGFVFDPKNYTIRFARDELRLDGVQNLDESELLIMDILTRRQVLGNASVNFGYRVQISYALKEDLACLQPFVDCTDEDARPLKANGAKESEAECQARQDDCYIDDTEEWIRLVSPFGTISGAARANLRVELEEAVADILSAGTYGATLTVIFDNGDRDSVPVRLVKTSPSGEYDGRLTVYIGDAANSLTGARPLTLSLRMKVEEGTTDWHALLEEHHLDVDEDLIDLTSGYRIKAQLHGAEAFAFTRGGATSSYEDEIPFVGLYSPDQGRIRLIGVIEIPADFCVSEDGACQAGQDQIQVVNPFRRTIRRQIELIGPYEDAIGRFHGLYREKISGLAADFDVTLEGGFILDQSRVDESAITLDAPILSPNAGAIAFPTDEEVLARIEDDITAYCGSFAANLAVLGEEYGALYAAGDVDEVVTLLGGADLSEDYFDHSTRAWAWAQFLSQGLFDAYLTQAARRGAPNEASVLGRTTVFPALLHFDEAVEQALAGLEPGTPPDAVDDTGWEAGDQADGQWQQAHLNIYDFLSSRMLPCDPDDPSPPPVCVDEDAARCGLALHRKAFLKGWIDLDLVDGTGANELHCPDTLSLVGCPDTAAGALDLFALQEHNRFWWDLGQILKFAGDRARSDAFMVLFRSEANAFAQQPALSYKSDRLRVAVWRYDQLLHEIVGPAAAKLLFEWPARAFKQWGYDWLGIMQEIADARMGALAELLDLERRVYMSTNDEAFVFAQHLMQHEYLVHVYLMALQAHWQQESFGYLGEAGPAFQRGQAVLNQLNPERNAIGLVSSRVYFENANAERSNWENYRALLVGEDGDGGALGVARATVADAVDELKAAMADLDSFEERLQESKFELEDKLVELCGREVIVGASGTPYVEGGDGQSSGTYCAHLMQLVGLDANGEEQGEFNTLRDCLFTHGNNCEGLSANYVCATGHSDYENALDNVNDCATITQTFTSYTSGGTDTGTIYGDLCVVPKVEDLHWIEVNGQRRVCVGGAMGELLQEKAKIGLQRRIVLKHVHGLLTAMQGFADYMQNANQYKDAIRGLATAIRWATFGIDMGLLVNDAVSQTITVAADAMKCTFIVGFSFGTNCVGSALGGITKTFSTGMSSTVKAVLNGIKMTLLAANDESAQWLSREADSLAVGQEIRAKSRDIGGLIDEYMLLTQDLVGVAARIDHVRYQAQVAADRYHQQVTFVAEHLVGRETGNLLLGDQLIREASESFSDLVLMAYKTVMAFIHHYNVATGEATTLINRSLAAVTLDDVQDLVDDLDDWAQGYCGLEAIDCDTGHNVEVLRFSVRDQLFGHLRDRVDAQTNTVVTAGEQFHNTVTNPPYVRRRVRGSYLADQVELTFDIPVLFKENTADGVPQWVIDPLSCNHLLDGHDPSGHTGAAAVTGTVAVNVEGRNLGDGDQKIRYELVRGATDYQRSCHAESVVEEIGLLPVYEYPIRKHVVGYAPQSTMAQQGEPLSFVTHSSLLSACVNHPEAGGDLDGAGCWRFFARDRALASSDWKIQLPLWIDGAATDNTWLLGEGLPDEARPIIEDIVIYFRYRTRPIQED